MPRLGWVCFFAISALLALGGCPQPAPEPAVTDPTTDGQSAADNPAGAAADTDTPATAGNTPADAAPTPIPSYSEDFSFLPRWDPPNDDADDSAAEDDDDESPVNVNAAAGLPTAEIDAVARQVITAVTALGAAAGLADERIHFGQWTMYEYGTCPVTRYASDFVWGLIALDFGRDAGCSGAATGGLLFKGDIAGYMALATRFTVLEWNVFSIAGHGVTGHLEVRISTSSNGAGLEGSCVVTTEGIGAAAGEVDIAYERSGAYVFESASLAVVEDGASYATTLSYLLIDPITHGNFVPAGGTVAFDLPELGVSVEVLFTTASPVDGTVWVSINGGGAVEYQLPGGGS